MAGSEGGNRNDPFPTSQQLIWVMRFKATLSLAKALPLSVLKLPDPGLGKTMLQWAKENNQQELVKIIEERLKLGH